MNKSVNRLSQIAKLKFDVPKYSVTEWFEVHIYGDSGLLIRSGLRHADGVTKSPYYYEKSFFGKNFKKEALIDFNLFLQSLPEQQ